MTIQVDKDLDNATLVVAINSKMPCAYAVITVEEIRRFPDRIHHAMAKGRAFYKQHEPGALPLKTMTWEEFEAWERDRMADRSEIMEIDQDAYLDAFGALPPRNYSFDGVMERWCIGEATHSTWYQQYARTEDRYLTKLADVTNPATWITLEDFAR